MCPEFVTYLTDHKATILVIGGMVVSSGVMTLPPPGEKFNLYTWLYDWSHQFLNMKNTRLVKEDVPTPPSNKETTNG